MNGVDAPPIDILVIEDNETDVKITLRAFNRAKLKNNIYVVNDGDEAFEFIHNEGRYQDGKKFPKPDLVLLDINLPKMDGFQLLEKFKKDPQSKAIPVIALTSSKRQEDIVKSYDHGAAGYIQKPVDYEEFARMIDTFNYYWHTVSRLPRR